MNYIIIKKPGMLTTIQDDGRYGYQKYGVSVSGVMDKESMEIANIIVGNKRNEAILEMTYTGDEIIFYANTVISITGGDMDPLLNNNKINMYQRINVNIGDVLNFPNLSEGFRTYLAIHGGFNLTKEMGSKSTYLKAKIGGFHGRKLLAGDKLYLNNYNSRSKEVERNLKEFKFIYNKIQVIRVLEGPDYKLFKDDSKIKFLNKEYTISQGSDRMGYRLIGEEIEQIESADIISRGITFGAIQVSGDKQPIIMMADRQTIGGYTVIANVISVDLPILAQLKPGDKVKFQKVSLEKAQSILFKKEKKIIELINDLINDDIYLMKNSKNYKITLNNKDYNVGVEIK